MARVAKGWSLKLHRSGLWYVRFTHEGKRREFSTGTRDKTAAYAEAQRIYAEFVTGRRESGRPSTSGGMSIVDAAPEWLASIAAEVDPLTLETYERYAEEFARFFGTVGRIEPLHESYIQTQLKAVQRKTVLKKLSGLRGLLRWAYGTHAPAIRSPLRTSTGKVRYDRRVTELSPEIVKKFLTAVEGRHHAREYFTLYYETSLRTSTLQGLSVPQHYARGRKELRITKELDKARYDRNVPLTSGARKALDRIAPEQGLIFGAHDYRDAIERACEKIGIPPFTPYDLRHAFGTHQVERSGNLPGVAYLMGHRNIATTAAKYVHPSKRAALEVLGKRK